MPATFLATGTPSSTNGSAPTPGLPAGLQAGDTMLAAFYSREITDGTVSISAGWDQVLNNRSAGGLLAAWVRKFQVGDSAPTFTLGGHVTGASGDTAIAAIAAWRPSVDSVPLAFSHGLADNASAQNIGPIGGVRLQPEDVVIVLGGKRDDWTSVATLTGDGLTWAEAGEPDATAGADAGLVAGYAINGSSERVVTAKTFAVTGGAAAAGKGAMIALSLVPTASLGVEYLLYSVNNTHSDPDKETRGCYKRGDLVLAMPLGHTWGTKELIPPAEGGKFARLRITDATHAWIKNFVRNKWNHLDPCGPELSGETTVRRRRIRIDVDLLPAGVLNTLNTTGLFETTWNAVRGFVRDKLTNQTGG